MSTTTFSNLAWEPTNLEKAVKLLATSTGATSLESDGLASLRRTRLQMPKEQVFATANRLGLTPRTHHMAYRHTRETLRALGTAILPLSSGKYIILLKAERWTCTVLAADGTRVRLPYRELRELLFAEPIAAVRERLAQERDTPTLTDERKETVLNNLQDEYLADESCGPIWQLAAANEQDWQRTLQQYRLPMSLGLHILLRMVWYALFFGALSFFAAASADGLVRWFVLSVGIVLWLSRIPLALVIAWLERWMGLSLGLAQKSNLFEGALRLNPDTVTNIGNGQLMGWLFASEYFIEGWLNRGRWFISSSVFLLLAGIVLALLGDLPGAAVIWGGLLASYAILFGLALRIRRRNDTHTEVSARLLERLQGHATRLVQEDNWYDDPDQELADDLRISRRVDTSLVWAWTVLPSLVGILIVLSLAPDFISGVLLASGETTAISLRVAALLFTLNEIQYLALAIPDVAEMLAAWWHTRPLRKAPANPPQNRENERIPPSSERPLLQFRDVQYRYAGSDAPVLTHIDLQIPHNARIVLRGSSGSGKSTLAALLSGLRQANRGVVLLNGYDLPTVGEVAWRQHIVLVPQFYANHLFDASLAFNLLLQPGNENTPDRRAQAEAVCRELGLGPLLDRMPAGLDQRVGATGWVLSHGERNRVFIARAILQDADLVIFDESFAALDPDTLQTALQVVETRARAVMIVSHER